MSILFTGGTGFIGAEIVRQLLQEDAPNVHIIHRSGNFHRLEGLLDRVELIQADLADHDKITSIIEKTRPEVIYHLGAILTGPGERDPQKAMEANGIGTYRLLEAARLNDVRQMLFASSIGTYGKELPDGPINDATVQRPVSVYGITKVFGENIGAYYKQKYGLDFRGLRYPSIIGPGVTTISIAYFTNGVIEKPALGEPYTVPVGPHVAVPQVYLRDAARAMIDLSRAPLESIETVNYLVNGFQPTPTIGEVAEAVRARIPDAQIEFESGSNLEAVFDRVTRPLDDSRARSEWGWSPQYDTDAMIDDFLGAF